MKNAILTISAFLILCSCACGPTDIEPVSDERTEPEHVSQDSGDTAKFTVTEAAVEVLYDAAESAKTKYIRATCTLGGCSGFVYSLDATNEFDDSNDQRFTFGEVTILIDNDSMERMNGTSLDFVRTSEAAGFKFDNPNQPPESEMAGEQESE